MKNNSQRFSVKKDNNEAPNVCYLESRSKTGGRMVNMGMKTCYMDNQHSSDKLI